MFSTAKDFKDFFHSERTERIIKERVHFGRELKCVLTIPMLAAEHLCKIDSLRHSLRDRQLNDTIFRTQGNGGQSEYVFG